MTPVSYLAHELIVEICLAFMGEVQNDKVFESFLRRFALSEV